MRIRLALISILFKTLLSSAFLNSIKMVRTRKQQKARLASPNRESSPVPRTPPTKKRPLSTRATPRSSGKNLSAPSTPSSVRKILRHDIENIMPTNKYKDLKVAPSELRPSATLTTGQCFHWQVINGDVDDFTNTPSSTSAWGTHDADEWIGTLRTRTGESMVIVIRETPETTLYRVLYGPKGLDYDLILREYFQLECQLTTLYTKWSRQDSRRLAQIAKCIPGVRLVDQDPWECLVSFICSSNNNIPRITKMVAALRETYGTPLITIPGDEPITFYSFPSLDDLEANATEADLRNCGMGYRAKYLMSTVETLKALGGEAYLHELRNCDDPNEVQEKLQVFTGVGRKVADCVALFSLRQADAIPVDTHVWNIGRRDYDNEGIWKETKSLTPTIYRQVGDMFRATFSPKAGWAHSLLFVAELPSFRAVLPSEIVREMDEFRDLERSRKEALKAEKKETRKNK